MFCVEKISPCCTSTRTGLLVEFSSADVVIFGELVFGLNLVYFFFFCAKLSQIGR